jgi:hypothetical protein
MRLNRLFIACYSSLILIGIAGCPKNVQQVKQKVVEIEVDSSLAPITPAPPPGNIVEWVVTTPGESFAVSWQQGLCDKNTPNPIPASYGHPAMCTIGPQTFTKQQPVLDYTYCFQGKTPDGKPRESPKYMMRVGPGGCPHC